MGEFGCDEACRLTVGNSVSEPALPAGLRGRRGAPAPRRGGSGGQRGEARGAGPVPSRECGGRAGQREVGAAAGGAVSGGGGGGQVHLEEPPGWGLGGRAGSGPRRGSSGAGWTLWLTRAAGRGSSGF